MTDNGIGNPNVEELLSELSHRLSGVGLGHRNEERLKTTLDEVCQRIQNILKVDSPTEYQKDFVLRMVSRREAESARKG